MSLIIGVRCKDGCLVVADRRNHVWTNGVATYRDDFRKVVVLNNYLVYNHGYNRIGNDRIVSGTGKKYVDLQLLVNLQRAKCSKVRPKLKRTFEAAYKRMKLLSGAEFSEEHDIEQLLS